MLADLAIRAKKIYIIDGYIESLSHIPPISEVSARLAIDHTIQIMKGNAVASQIVEVIQVGCIMYGLNKFYSEDNKCNWEGNHSIGYVIMFIILTLGMILVFKWFLKLSELLIIFLVTTKNWVISLCTARRRRGPAVAAPIYNFNNGAVRPLLSDHHSNLLSRLREPLQPEIYQVETLLLMH